MNKYAVEKEIFSRMAKYRRCGSCFRCHEADDYPFGFYAIYKKPRKGKEVRCTSACSPECTGVDMKACEWWEPRWYWNLGASFNYHSYIISRWWCENVRMPIGSRRKPVPLEWVDCLGIGGELVKGGEPRCPHCGEMPYDFEQCQFCGQRFVEGSDD